jgi:hypothetical protein
MKKLLLTLACAVLITGVASAQTINFYTAGTGPNGTNTLQTSQTVTAGNAFSLDAYMTFTGFTAGGLSFWLEAPNAIAPFLTFNGETVFNNWDPNGAGSATFTVAGGTSANYTREGRDLGSTSNFDTNGNFTDPLAAGTYQVALMNFTLAAGAPAGTYILHDTVLSPVASEITDTAFGPHNVAQTSYTITVAAVPEPATWSLLGLGAVASVGLNVLRRRRRA